AQVGNNAAQVAGGNGDQVQDNNGQGQPLQLYASQQQQSYLVVGHQGGAGQQQAHYGSGSAQHGGVRSRRVQQVKGQYVQQAACNAPQQVQRQHPLVAQEGAEQVAEPVQVQHVKENMENVEMRKHVGEQAPGLGNENARAGVQHYLVQDKSQ